MLRKSPGFTIIAVLTLALGIGANTAIFGVVDSLLLRPLPVENPSQLTVLAFRQGNGPLLTQFSIADFRDMRSQTTGAFSDMLGFQLGFDGLSFEGKADRSLTAYVTGNFFSMLGIKAYLGRLILPSEGKTPGADPVIVLSYSYWKAHLGSDQNHHRQKNPRKWTTEHGGGRRATGILRLVSCSGCGSVFAACHGEFR